MSDIITQFDKYLSATGPAALVIRESLSPVEGLDGVVFPSTFAADTKSGFKGGYNIDGKEDGPNVCLIDSVGSQANRIEPQFKEEPYKQLVPQIFVKAGEKEVSILDAGHRAGDALVRCSALDARLNAAFKAAQAGDSEPLARIAPTSLVFGVWDSRDTQAKMPRLVSSTIRAFNVRKLTRGAVYTPPLDYSKLEVFSEADKTKAEENNKSPLAQRGFVHNPASASHGGVIAEGGIRRDATLALAALKLAKAGTPERTEALRRYILGLALTAFTMNTSAYLRQGCMLVIATDKPRSFDEVYPDGTRITCTITNSQALDYAVAVAKAFGVAAGETVQFDPKLAKEDLKKAEKSKKAE